MEQLKTVKSKIFFHMGPGFHAQIERDSFNAAWPEIDFWDQPDVGSLGELIERASQKVSQLYNDSGSKVTIIAHSFGGQIARQLTAKIPDKIQKLSLINSAFDPFECFLNLAPHLSRGSDFGLALDAVRNSDIETKMKFILHLAVSPEMAALYWYDENKFKEFVKKSEHYPTLRVDIFLAIFTDFLKVQTSFKDVQWNGEVNLYFGVEDRLLEFNKDILPWKNIFPNAQPKSLSKVGHYPYFEDISHNKQIFG